MAAVTAVARYDDPETKLTYWQLTLTCGHAARTRVLGVHRKKPPGHVPCIACAAIEKAARAAEAVKRAEELAVDGDQRRRQAREAHPRIGQGPIATIAKDRPSAHAPAELKGGLGR